MDLIKGTLLGDLYKSFPKLIDLGIIKEYTSLSRIPQKVYPEVKLRHIKPIKFEDDSIYTGQVDSEDNKYGIGVYYIPNIGIFEGFFKSNEIKGYGRLYKSNMIIDSKWRGLRPKDKAKIVNIREDTIYEGEINNLMPHGLGKQIKVAAWTYYGNFTDGMRHGKGRMTWENKEEYFGDFSHDKQEGIGKYTWPDGSEYEGDYARNKMHGNGILKMVNDYIYEGQFANGMKQGHGICTWVNGKKYEGFWMKNKFDGIGTETNVKGEVTTGIWRNGNLVNQNPSRLEDIKQSLQDSFSKKPRLKTEQSLVESVSESMRTKTFEIKSASPINPNIKLNIIKNSQDNSQKMESFKKKNELSIVKSPKTPSIDDIKYGEINNSLQLPIMKNNRKNSDKEKSASIDSSSDEEEVKIPSIKAPNLDEDVEGNFSMNDSDEEGKIKGNKRFDIDVSIINEGHSPEFILEGKNMEEKAKDLNELGKEIADFVLSEGSISKKNIEESKELSEKNESKDLVIENRKTDEIEESDAEFYVQKKIFVFDVKEIQIRIRQDPLFQISYKIFKNLYSFEYEPTEDVNFEVTLLENWIDLPKEKVYRGYVDFKGMPNSNGVLLQKGRIYQGGFLNGKKHGLGRLITALGKIYEGYWRRGKKSGFGVFQSEVEFYCGDWELGLYHGKGILENEKGQYDGRFIYGVCEGKGTLRFKDGKIFTGDFENGVPHGYGDLKFGSTLESGHWKSGVQIRYETAATKKVTPLGDSSYKSSKPSSSSESVDSESDENPVAWELDD
ncbi:hypothetical protein SteCoe_31205 [Stentor coeruleus]|uniref:Uncharacterized protein n=1 Tax=Stentor coeruleus TaxID=5963 RepID=A0A1R2B1Y7_9CILI|nr:hypothetical protein SteCoe_31205 [Stentor coeruleus]